MKFAKGSVCFCLSYMKKLVEVDPTEPASGLSSKWAPQEGKLVSYIRVEDYFLTTVETRNVITEVDMNITNFMQPAGRLQRTIHSHFAQSTAQKASFHEELFR